MREQDAMNNGSAMRRLQVGICVRVLLIFLGIIGIQMVAYMIVAVGYTVWFLLQSGGVVSQTLLEELALKMQGDTDFLMGVSALSAALSMIWCGILYYRSSWRTRNKDYRTVFYGGSIGGIVAVGMGGCAFFSILLTIISVLFPDAFRSYSSLMENLTTGTPALTYLYVILIGPVSEELIFRGAMLDRFRLAFPVWPAILLQAFLFGVYHMNLIQGIYAFCLGAVLGLICYKTDSILTSMLTHCLFNATSYLLTAVTEMIPQAWFLLLLFLAGIAAFVLGIRYFWKKEEPYPSEK